MQRALPRDGARETRTHRTTILLPGILWQEDLLLKDPFPWIPAEV